MLFLTNNCLLLHKKPKDLVYLYEIAIMFVVFAVLGASNMEKLDNKNGKNCVKR